MTELLTAAQMRALEQAAMDSGTVTGLELMERAGQGVVEAIFEEWPELANVEWGASPPNPPGYLEQEEKRRAVVLCGPGNNGGDGFVVARLLAARGWAVEVFLYGDAGKLPPDARLNCERWREIGEVRVAEPGAASIGSADLLIDALFGTGLTRPNMISVPACDRIAAVDVPSGLCADSGRTLGACARADLTVSFERPKQGHMLADGPALCGKLAVKQIGLRDFILSEILPPEAPVLSRLADGRSSARHLAKQTGHKFSHGHALILTGGAGKTGAARLAARGALRIGAGLVTLGVPGSAQMEVASQITALMLTRVNDAEGLVEALQDRRLNALCLGPGLGLDRARDLVPAALRAGRATVLDADALSAFEEAPQALFDLLHDRCVITPHGGEFARLFPDLADKLAEAPSQGPVYSKVDAVRAAATRAGCVVLFKGPDTVIAAPDGQTAIHAAQYDRAAPWLATAGSGDVLAGFITGLLARGLPPMQAAETAAWLHVECARAYGPGLIAEDLPDILPEVFRSLGL